ncbi:MAG: ABC transporter ATP-binding protein [Candidatus Aminicenantales bacterium]
MFKIYARPADLFWEAFFEKPRFKPFWALRDVSFELRRGQVLGIVGRNGAGKSTLLRILTGTLDKTSGDVEIHGRISSILELGTGFNPEQTGRENIHLGGLMVGLTREEIKRKLEWIIDFSELREFIDQPFRTYSSGMQARLTFSTAVCVDPDILIVDEALAVGDAAFQVKCFDKFRQLVKNNCTILFVSHAVNVVNLLCDEAILFERGRILMTGRPQDVTNEYNRMLFSKAGAPLGSGEPSGSEGAAAGDAGPQTHPVSSAIQAQPNKAIELIQPAPAPVPAASPLDTIDLDHLPPQMEHFLSPSALRYGDRRVEIFDVGLLDARGDPTKTVAAYESCLFFCRLRFNEPMSEQTVGMRIRTPQAVDVFAANTQRHGLIIKETEKDDVLTVSFRVSMVLGPGQYLTTFGVRPVIDENFNDRLVDAFVFTVSADKTVDPACMALLGEQVAVRLSKKAAKGRTHDDR